jgi:hypothetical protein
MVIFNELPTTSIVTAPSDSDEEANGNSANDPNPNIKPL